MNDRTIIGTRRFLTVSVTLACAALSLSSCGDDGDAQIETGAPTTDPALDTTPTVAPGPDTSAASTTEAEVVATTIDTEGEPAVCSPFFEVSAAFAGQPDPTTLSALLDDVDTNAPDAIADQLALVTTNARTALDTGDLSVFETPEFGSAIGTAETWMVDNCDFATRTEIIAVDYGYEGQADEYPTGRTAVTLLNEGTEAHELLLLRKNDDVDLTIEELLALPESESATMTTYVGGAFAGSPGATGNLIVDLMPGNYVAVCTIPAGTALSDDGTPTEGAGQPHVVLGMSFEFTVA